ncbi:MAG: hydantoinase B/oxoprolinase family protein [Candidatus Hydrogenedentes bacterium]|nr:hydantoinase B/oxoprolinase family protein [Candidatus Hydrogenedentota bacterium]
MGREFWIDRGGTFTDVYVPSAVGGDATYKYLSENPAEYADAAVHAIRRHFSLADGAPIPSGAIEGVYIGTTLATNALLERKGARVGLLITRGFQDLLEIGYQDRPKLFALEIVKPSSLAAVIAEVDERILADGTVRVPLDVSSAERALQRFRAAHIESLAVVLLNSHANPEHELAVERIAAPFGFRNVSLSHRVANEIKAVPRGDTTLVDAYLTPVIRDYAATLRQELGPDVRLKFMKSSGGLVDAELFRGKDAILSGPAGGVVACRDLLQRTRFKKLIAFDMGGTSTDVSRIDEHAVLAYEKRVAGVRVRAPMFHIDTVAAGGGSILSFRDGRFTVGPESAGANPGPACYGRGGPATITDANVVLGRVRLWSMKSLAESEDAAIAAAHSAIETIARQIEREDGRVMSVEDVAMGFVRVANENMARPIKEIAAANGIDPREYALVCFGSAGPQHACGVADALGIRDVLVPRDAAVFSAYGIGTADIEHNQVEPVLCGLDASVFETLDSIVARLTASGAAQVQAQGVPAERIRHRADLEVRYAGTDATLTVAYPAGEVRAEFETEYARLHGYTMAQAPVEIVTVRLTTIGDRGHTRAERDAVVNATDDDGDVAATRLIAHANTTIVADPGWSVSLREDGGCAYCHLHREDPAAAASAAGTNSDPVLLEIFNNAFASIAEQMGSMLERVAHSVNIKERLDFSCAVFDPRGELVANAHHIPVHLGAMGESVKAVIAARDADMRPGDVYATNDPYAGGSHLPDVTVVTPVFDDSGKRIFFVANRGHHADIGGIAPGSMPPFSTTLDDEGVVIRNELLVRGGEFREREFGSLLISGKYAARNIDERLSDLRAQIAANNQGVRLLCELCGKYSLDVVHAYMGHVRANAAACMRAAIASLPDGVHRFEDRLDCGARIVCSIAIDGDRAVVDFAETDAQLNSNLNAPPAVTIAAVLYVFRTLIAKEIPLNGGCLEPIEIRIPEGSLLNPQYPAAVVGGNVETSQRVCDVLYGALGVLAAGQGTMNNFLFGNETFGYYETICGGAGAGDGFDGASGVHIHMTNTRITDPEVLERRYPVVVREFGIRRGSGGAGKWRGGDGARRSIEFLEPMQVSLLTERRSTQPFGLNGGAPGAPGRNLLTRSGVTTELQGHATVRVEAGDIVTIETPGGGGYGE